ncbi:MAG: hypothetical protein RLZZ46_29 [Bacteroidota bacterium]|jgi:hypothetical protein
MANYSYRLLSVENVSILNELFTTVFKIQPKPNFIFWKYFGNPAGNAIVAGAFSENNQLVASGAMIPEIMNVNNKTAVVFKFTDLMTHPEHQKKGLSKNISALINEEISKLNTPFSYTLCSKIATRSFISNKWQHLAGITNFFKPYLLIKSAFLFPPKPNQQIRHFDQIGENLDSYRFKKKDMLIHLVKSKEFLQWRTSNPNFNYGLLVSYNQENIAKAYLIYSISPNNLLNVLDIESSCADQQSELDLLMHAEQIVLKNKYRGIVILAVRKTSFYNLIKKAGYLVNPFQKGPLKSILDLNAIEHKNGNISLFDLSLWEINGLNYDDV